MSSEGGVGVMKMTELEKHMEKLRLSYTPPINPPSPDVPKDPEVEASMESMKAFAIDSMEITKYNYEKKIEEVVELIKICDFVAIDATVETTGLLRKDETWNPKLIKDRPSYFGEWYDHIKENEKSKFLLEVGVALFKRVPGRSRELECEVYNIPIFPACVDDNELARFHGSTCPRLVLDGYGREFMQSVDFDVNKPFYKAAPYLNKNLRDAANNYMIENPGFMVASRKRSQDPHLMPEIVEHVDEEKRKNILDRLKGVVKIFEAIASEEVPVVGHHLLLKLMLIYKDFFQYLPDSYHEYREEIRKLFKVVYDTKYIADQLDSMIKLPECHRKNMCGKNLYELFRNSNRKEYRIPIEYLVFVGGRSQVYCEDVQDLKNQQTLEDDLDSFSYVAGFDAFLSGLLFLDLVGTMDFNHVNCWLPRTNGIMQLQEYPDEDLIDLLDAFLLGQAPRFNHKLYDAPPYPDEMSKSAMVKKVFEKRKMWYDKRMEERKQKKEKERKLKMFALTLREPIVGLGFRTNDDEKTRVRV